VAGKPVRPVNAIDQTRRMLSLVTYLRERPGARIEDVARAFGITEDELVSDLDVLPMCGTSFRGGDLLDIDTDGERIWWHNPAALGAEAAEPLRLAADEATALLVAARAVATLPGCARATGRRCCGPPRRWRPRPARRPAPAPGCR
jgi:proteasome accessory factor C